MKQAKLEAQPAQMKPHFLHFNDDYGITIRNNKGEGGNCNDSDSVWQWELRKD